MPDLSTRIVSVVSNDSTLLSLIGTGVGGRAKIYPVGFSVLNNRASAPFITYTVSYGASETVLEAMSGEVYFYVWCEANHPRQYETLTQIKDALHSLFNRNNDVLDDYDNGYFRVAKFVRTSCYYGIDEDVKMHYCACGYSFVMSDGEDVTKDYGRNGDFWP